MRRCLDQRWASDVDRLRMVGWARVEVVVVEAAWVVAALVVAWVERRVCRDSGRGLGGCKCGVEVWVGYTGLVRVGVGVKGVVGNEAVEVARWVWRRREAGIFFTTLYCSCLLVMYTIDQVLLLLLRWLMGWGWGRNGVLGRCKKC